MANAYSPGHVNVQIDTEAQTENNTASKPRNALECRKLNVITAMHDLEAKLAGKPSQLSEARIVADKELMDRSLECYSRKAEQIRADLTLTVEEETQLDKDELELKERSNKLAADVNGFRILWDRRIDLRSWKEAGIMFDSSKAMDSPILDADVRH